MIKTKYIIHVIYASSLFLIVLAILGYLVWEKTIYTENQETKTNNCLLQATTEYNNSWAYACSKQAETVQFELNNCIEKAKHDSELIWSSASKSAVKNAYLSSVASCKSIYGEPNPAPDCMLPNTAANNLREQLQKNQDLCSKHY